MKVSKTSLLLVAIGILVISVVGLGTVYYQQVRELNQLNAQSKKLALAQPSLKPPQPEKLSASKADLERQLSQLASRSEAAKTTLSQPVKSSDIAAVLSDFAKAQGLVINRFTVSGPASATLEGVPCSLTSIGVTVEGDVASIVHCVVKLNRFGLTTVVNSIRITVPEAGGWKKASADIQVAAYVREDR
ncbi:MAG: hypothetical protein V1737_03395 [Chloroflexota bacterium]